MAKWQKVFTNNTYFSLIGFPPYYSVGAVTTRILDPSSTPLRSHKIWRLLPRAVCARKLIIRAENSSSVGKLTAVSSETPRWRSVLQRKATVNFNVLEDEEVQVQSQKLPIVLQINRVYYFVWVYPKYKQGIAWSNLLDEIYLQTKAIIITGNFLYCNCQKMALK